MTGPVRRVVGEEDGVVGGVEMLPFGFLVFVVGTLLLVNAWGVIDGKLAASAAAREATRAYVEFPGDDPAGALAAARQAAADAFEGHRVNTDTLQVDPVDGTRFERCAVATFRVEYVVPAIQLPWGHGFGSGIPVSALHSELVDPYRSGVPDPTPEATC